MIITNHIKKLYQEYDIELHRSRLGLLIMISIVFIMIFSALDTVMYGAIAGDLIVARIAVDAILILMFFAVRKKWVSNVKLMSIAWSITIVMLINILVMMTSDISSSPYYAGLNLIIIASAALLPWTWYEMLSICFIMLVLYTGSCLVAVDYAMKNLTGYQFNSPLFINNLFFLFSTSSFCTLAAHVNTKLRFKEFCLNYELEEKNEKLQSTQAQLVQSEKMSAIGNLSAGLLHEVNNPLNYTMTAIQIMKMDPSINADPELQDTVKDIEEGMTRIKNIVTDLRAFAYPEEADKKNKFPILNAVENSLRFTASECQDVKRIVNIDENLMVSASKTHVVQVLINLISNASRAIHRVSEDNYKGVISIEAKEEGTRVVVSVFDNGTGMSEATLKRVFDPFFTTNEVGKGMGLGLSVSHTIVKNHGGNLSATSKLGEGSRFFFDLGV